MRLTCFVVWKSWVSNPVRTILTVLGVALGIAVVTAIHVLDHNTIHSRLRQRLQDYGHVDLELLPNEVSRTPGDVRAQLTGMTDYVASVGLLHGGASGALVQAVIGQRAPEPVWLYGLSPLPSRSFAFYDVAKGEDLSDLDGDEFVLVGAVLADELGLVVGQELTLAPPPVVPVERCVDGKLVTADAGVSVGEHVTVRVKGILSHYALARRHAGKVVIGSFATARRVAPYLQSVYQVNRAPGTNPDVLKQVLEADFQVLDKRSAMVGEGADERAFRNGVKVVGLLALVMGMLVVFQTLSQTLLERLKQIGLMRCLGISRSSVATMFLVDGLALALLGAVIGGALGIGIAWGMGKMQWTTLGLAKEIHGFEVPPRPVFFAMGLGVFFTLAGSAFPLWKARNLLPMQVLQARGLGDSGYVLRGVNVFLFLLLVFVLPVAYLAMTPLLAAESREMGYVLLQVAGVILLFGGVLLIAPGVVKVGARFLLWPLRWLCPLPGFLVSKAVGRGPGRFSVAVCGLAVVLIAMVALKHITYGLRGEIEQFSADTMDDHLFFRGGKKRVEDVARVQAIDGVASAEFFAGEAHVGFILRGMPVDCLVRSGGLLHENLEMTVAYRDTRSLIVSQRWAELHWKKARQSISVLAGSGSKRYRILMVSDGAGFFPEERAWAITAPRWLRRDFCVGEASVDRIALHLKPGASPEAIRAAVTEIFPHVHFKKGNDVRAYLLLDVTRDFWLFDVLLTMILFLVGVGLVNTMTIAAVGRAREIGVLRALGMDDRSIRQTFLIEGVVVAGLATVVAIAVGLPLGYVVVEGLNRVAGLHAPVVIPWLFVGLVPVFAFLTGLLAAVLPGARAIKMNPAEAVRYE